MASISNNAEGGSDGTATTTGNSGGSSGTAWDTVQRGTNATNEFDSAQAANGTYSYLHATGVTSTTTFNRWLAAIAALWPSGMTTHYGRVYFRVAALPAADRTIVELVDATAATNRGNLRIRSTGTIRLRNAANGTVVTTTTVISVDTWYRLEWRVDGSTTGAYQVHLFAGNSLTPLEAINGGTDNFGGTIGGVNFGYVAAAASQANLWLDGMQINDTGLPSIEVTAQTIAVGQVVETNTANAMAKLKTKAIGQATGTNTANAVTVPAATSALTENFSGGALDTAKWTAVNAAGITGSQTGGRYEIATSNNTPGYSSLTTVAPYDLTGDRLMVKVPDSGDRSIPSLEVYIAAQNDTGTDRLFFVLAGSFMGIYQTVNTSQTFLTAVAYDPLVDVYFRLRESAGTTYWDTSTNGSTWTNKHSVANPIPVSGLHLQLVVGEWDNEAAGATTVAFDDVGIPGGQTVAVGQSTETNTANALGRAKAASLGLAGETDTANALGRLKAVAVGLASETDTADALGRAKVAALGLASETDTANALGRAKVASLGLAGETDTAHEITSPHQVATLGRAVETDTARPIRAARRVTRPSTGYVTRPDTGLVLRP